MRVSRRSVLAAAGLGAAAVAAGTSRTPRAAAIPVTREEHRALVIGSGFGGSVAALRLSQAGVPVTVLERGKRWPTGPNMDTFPTARSMDKRVLWYGTTPEGVRAAQSLVGQPLDFEPYVGLLEAIVGVNMVAFVPAALGGGSLSYEGVSLQPSAVVFHRIFPSGLDYELMDRVHYPRVARMLQLATAPDELIESKTYYPSRFFKERAEAAGYPVDKLHMPIDWNYALAELRGEMKPSYTNGDCFLGVNNGGKHSLDVTYLAQAEATGNCTIRTHHNVSSIARAADGRWVVHATRTDDHGNALEEKILTTGALVLAAGSMNTSRLLVEAQAHGTIPGLPDEVGECWGTNGDRIYLWSDPLTDFGAEEGGPCVFGSMDWDDPATANTIVQAAVPPAGLDTRATMVIGYGMTPDRGHFRYDALQGRAVLRFPFLGDQASYRVIDRRMHEIVGANGALVDTYTALPNTWHGVGGVVMDRACDLEGRVLGQRGLYVLDGALIPGSVGACNPSMTIAAVAERAMDVIVRDDVGTVI